MSAPRAPAAVVVATMTIALLAGRGDDAASARPGRSAIGTPRECANPHWIGAWEMSPSDAGYSLDDQTVRMLLTPHVDGRRVRLRFSNRYATAPVTLADVRVGIGEAGSPAISGPNRNVTFDGRRRVTIEPGLEALSDPVRLRFEAFQPLAVSVYVPGDLSVTGHHTAEQTSFQSPPGNGDTTADTTGLQLSQPITSWLLVDSVETRTRRPVGAVVAFGDSLTEGVHSPIDADERYPDFLARRLLARYGDRAPSVLNAGISGNGLVYQASPLFGSPGDRRLRPDVLDQPGVTHAIVLEGVNDLNVLPASYVIAGLRDVIDRLRRHAVRVTAGTIPPRLGTRRLRHRTARVNRWLRTRSGARVVDFNRVLKDPAQPHRLAAAYDSGDHIHPNAAGYAAMARAIPLNRLKARTCH